MKKKITLQNRWNGKANVYVRDRQPTADHGVRNGTAYGVGAKAIITNSLNWRGIYSFQLWLFWVNESRRGRTKDRSRIMNKVVAAAAKSGNAELFYSLSFAICSTLFTHFSSLSLFLVSCILFLASTDFYYIAGGCMWKRGCSGRTKRTQLYPALNKRLRKFFSAFFCFFFFVFRCLQNLLLLLHSRVLDSFVEHDFEVLHLFDFMEKIRSIKTETF